MKVSFFIFLLDLLVKTKQLSQSMSPTLSARNARMCPLEDMIEAMYKCPYEKIKGVLYPGYVRKCFGGDRIMLLIWRSIIGSGIISCIPILFQVCGVLPYGMFEVLKRCHSGRFSLKREKNPLVSNPQREEKTKNAPQPKVFASIYPNLIEEDSPKLKKSKKSKPKKSKVLSEISLIKRKNAKMLYRAKKADLDVEEKEYDLDSSEDECHVFIRYGVVNSSEYSRSSYPRESVCILSEEESSYHTPHHFWVLELPFTAEGVPLEESKVLVKYCKYKKPSSPVRKEMVYTSKDSMWQCFFLTPQTYPRFGRCRSWDYDEYVRNEWERRRIFTRPGFTGIAETTTTTITTRTMNGAEPVRATLEIVITK